MFSSVVGRVCAVAALVFVPLLVPTPATAADVSTVDVTFRSHGLVFRGTVVKPPDDNRRHPAMVMVDGSGPHTRADHRAEAQAFARAGIVVLIYDKRTVGYSMFQRDFSVLADDALAAADVLRGQPAVDPERVGMWALSEGTWVTEIAATRSPKLAFLVLIGASGLPPARQQAWSTREYLLHNGVRGSLVGTVAGTFTRLAASAGLFPEAEFDSAPYLRRITQPVLAIWGANDKSSPPAESGRILGGTLRTVDVRFMPGANHDLHPSADGFVSDESSYVAGYVALVDSWVDGATAPRPDLAVPPRQSRSTFAVDPLAGWESVPVQTVMFVLIVVALACYPVTALRRRPRQPAAPAARTLAAGGLVVALGTPIFLFSAANPQSDFGPLVLGRPMLWLALQLLALTCVVATVVVGIAGWRERARPIRTGILLTGGTALAIWSAYWGLLLP